MISKNAVEARLREHLQGITHLAIEDLTGTEDHYRAVIVASAFQGKSRIEQHQLVYTALSELMHGPIHALSLQTFTPESWEQKNGAQHG